jgi:hypothetical protein
MNYYCRHWNESRGDEYDAWGEATYYFAAGEDGYVTRQMEIYAGGQVLKYDLQHAEDEYGGLTEALLDLEEYAPFLITATAFDAAWEQAAATQRTD